MDLAHKELSDKCSTAHCGGKKHCKRRICNPADSDCRECIQDADEAISEAIVNRCNPEWP